MNSPSKMADDSLSLIDGARCLANLRSARMDRTRSVAHRRPRRVRFCLFALSVIFLVFSMGRSLATDLARDARQPLVEVASLPEWAQSLWPHSMLNLVQPWSGKNEELVVLSTQLPTQRSDGWIVRLEKVSSNSKKSTLLEIPARGVSQASAVDLNRDGRPEILWISNQTGQGPELNVVEISSDSSRSLLTIPARSFSVEDVDHDSRPDLIAVRGRPGSTATVPIVYRWNGRSLSRTLDGLERYYRSVELSTRERLTKNVEFAPSNSQFCDQAVARLDLALLLEYQGRKLEAFEEYQALLRQAAIPGIVGRDTAAEKGAVIGLVYEAKQAMARLAGLRILGDDGKERSDFW